jgi:hypothetical protein
MLHKHLGDEIKARVASSPIDKSSMLICLTLNNGRVEITNIVQGHESHDRALELLKEARNRFDVRIESPHSAGPLWSPVKNEVTDNGKMDFWNYCATKINK